MLKRIKRTISVLIISLILLMPLFTFKNSVFAYNETPYLEVSERTVNRGTYFDVDVVLNDNSDGLLGLKVSLVYDHSVMELESVSRGSALRTLSTFVSSPKKDNTGYSTYNKVDFLFEGGGRLDTSEGTILTLRFKTKETKDVGRYTYSIYGDPDNVIGANNEIKTMGQTNGNGECVLNLIKGVYTADIYYNDSVINYESNTTKFELEHYEDYIDLEESDLVKEEDDKYTYTFNGWSEGEDSTTNHAIYVAIYKQTPKEYTVTTHIGIESDTGINYNNPEIISYISSYNNTFTRAYGTSMLYSSMFPTEKFPSESPTYTFSGFYLDEECTEPAKNATMPSKDLDLYGYYKFNVEDGNVNKNTISFTTRLDNGIFLDVILTKNYGLHSFAFTLDIDSPLSIKNGNIIVDSNSILYNTGIGSYNFSSLGGIYKFEFDYSSVDPDLNLVALGTLFSVELELDELLEFSNVGITGTCLENEATVIHSDGSIYLTNIDFDGVIYETSDDIGNDIVASWIWNEDCSKATCILTRRNGSQEPVMIDDNDIEIDYSHGPTDTDPGYLIYHAKVTYLGKVYTSQNQRFFNATVHTYEKIKTNWVRNGINMDATFTLGCTCHTGDERIYREVDANVVMDSTTKADKLIYHASATYNGVLYEDSCEIDKPIVKFIFNNGIQSEQSDYYVPGDKVIFPSVTVPNNKSFIGFKYGEGSYVINLTEDFIVEFDNITFTAVYENKINGGITVVDENNNPIEGVKVIIYENDNEVDRKVTNSDGKVSLIDIEYGNYRVEIIYTYLDGEDEIVVTRTYILNVYTSSINATYKIDKKRFITLVEGDGSSDNLDKAISNSEINSITKSSDIGSTIEIEIKQKREISTDLNANSEIKSRVAFDYTLDRTAKIVEILNTTLFKTTKTISSLGEEIISSQEEIKVSYDYQYNYYPISDNVYRELSKVNGTSDYIFLYKRHVDSNDNVKITKLTKVSEVESISANYECFYIKRIEDKEYIVVKQKEYSLLGIGVSSYILKNENKIRLLQLNDWITGQVPNSPLSVSDYGNPIYYYSDALDGIYTTNIPTRPGRYFLKAIVNEGDTYKGCEKTIEFTINEILVTIPLADRETYTYNGRYRTYQILTNDFYNVYGNVQKSAGTYAVVVSLKDRINTKWADGSTSDKVYIFTINKATYDMDGIEFNSKEFLYDKEEHGLTIEGELEDGLVVSYDIISKINVGAYLVKATFTGDYDNYEEVAPMYALLYIKNNINLWPLIIILFVLGLALGFIWFMIERRILDLREEVVASIITPFTLLLATTVIPKSGELVCYLLGAIDIALAIIVIIRLIKLINIRNIEGIYMRKREEGIVTEFPREFTIKLDKEAEKLNEAINGLTVEVAGLKEEIRNLKDKPSVCPQFTCPYYQDKEEPINKNTQSKEIEEKKEEVVIETPNVVYVEKEETHQEVVKEVETTETSMFTEEDFNEESEEGVWLNEDGTPRFDTDYPDWFIVMMEDLTDLERELFKEVISNGGIRSSIRRPIKERYDDEAHFLIHFFSSTRFRSMITVPIYEKFHDRLVKYLHTDYETSMLDIKMINIYYLHRNDDSSMLEKAKEYCIKDIDHEINGMGVRNVRLASIKKMIIILTSEENYDEAIRYCDIAIKYGLLDFKEDGFENRKAEIIQKKEKAIAKELKKQSKKRGRKKKKKASK